MNFRIFLPIAFILPLLFQACNRSVAVPNQYVQLSDTADYALENWKLIGPFYSDSIHFDTILKYDNLASFGICEATANAKSLEQLKPIHPLPLFYTPDTFEYSYHNRYGMIELDGIANSKKSGILYAACVINSSREQDLVFMTGSDENAQLILNGTFHDLPVKNTYRLVFQNYVFAHLKQGENLLIVKLSNTNKPWEVYNNKEPWHFILNYCSPRRFNSYWLKLEKMLIRNPVVPFQRDLRFATQIHPVDTIRSVEIIDTENHLVCSATCQGDISLHHCPEGLYELRITTNRESYRQHFYYGDIHQAFRKLIPKAEACIKKISNESSAHNIAALIDRYRILVNHYKNSDYLQVSESVDGKSYQVLDSLILKTSRVVPLHRPQFVKLTGLQASNSLLNTFEFYRKQGDSVLPVNYQQTADMQVLGTSPLDRGTVIQTQWNPWAKNELYFSFPVGRQPDYLSVPTDFDLDVSKELRITGSFIFENREIERRFVFLYNELQQIVSAVENGKEAFKHVPGTHFRAFISDIEEQKQYYVVQSPQSVQTDTTPKALVVIVPWVFAEHIPFLRSNIVADIHIHEMYQWQADLQDMIIVHANARTFERTVTEPIGIKNIFNTIEAVKQDYNIDTTRIHLFAYCGGSELATMMVCKYPHKFASLGIVGGYAMPAGNRWMRNNYSLNFTENLTNTPVYIIHGELDSHTPVYSIKNFVEVARQNGNSQIRFEIEPELTFEAYPRLRHQEQMFEFFKQNQVAIPSEIHYSTAQNKTHTAYWLQVFPKETGSKATAHARANGNTIRLQAKKASVVGILPHQAPIDTNETLRITINGTTTEYTPPLPAVITLKLTEDKEEYPFEKNQYTEGPVMNIFSDKFLLVTSTGGTINENLQANTLADEFAKMWEHDFFVSPRVKKDSEITDEDICHSNLVLFGNPNTNRFFKRVYPQLLLTLSDNAITLANKTFTGSSLGYTIACPNPLNPKKYLLLIGGNKLQYTRLRKGNPAHNGYYDYEIYACDSLDQYLKEQGYFNQHWFLQTP